MSQDESPAPALEVYLVQVEAKPREYQIVIHNRSAATIRNVFYHMAEGGIPVPGDLGSTIFSFDRIDELAAGARHQLDKKFSLYDFSFYKSVGIREDDYLDDPLRIWLLYLDPITGRACSVGLIIGKEDLLGKRDLTSIRSRPEEDEDHHPADPAELEAQYHQWNNNWGKPMREWIRPSAYRGPEDAPMAPTADPRGNPARLRSI